MQSNREMVEYYARRAREYELIYAKPERQAELKTLRERIGPLFAGRRVLEVACGTGYWTEVIAGAARSVVAIDINEEVLEIARTKAMEPGKVTFLKGDVYEMPQVEGCFDGGLAAFWWSHVPKERMRLFLEGFHRHLEPGAFVLIMDNAFEAQSSTPVHRRDANGNTFQLRQLKDGTTHEVLKNFPTERELRDAVAGLGERVEVQFLQYYWTLTYAVTAESAGI